jgi:predicted ArsR family transcriptional regulator
MSVALNQRFLETTRGQILALIRRGRQTVEELAAALELTDNAVRNHLATLEVLFSRAYPSVLTTVVESIVNACPPDQIDELLRDAGRRLARQAGGRATGTLENRVRAAAAALTALGGDVTVAHEEGSLRIRGSGCPLSASVSKQPGLCRAVETLVSEVAGAHARTCCEHGERPRCCFAIDDE